MLITAEYGYFLMNVALILKWIMNLLITVFIDLIIEILTLPTIVLMNLFSLFHGVFLAIVVTQ